MIREEILSKAKPIRFDTEMVRAILNDRKTVIRRPVKPPPSSEMPNKYNICKMPILTNHGIKTLWYMDDVKQYPFKRTRYFEKVAPYEIGDILYVRETWTKGCIVGDRKFRYVSQGEMSDIIFKEECIHNNICTDGVIWKPSIHMPKWAARIFLRVTSVRMERLQNITEEQAIAEGCNGIFSGTGETIGSGWSKIPQDEFSEIWDSTVKKSDLDKYGWEANPWVWVIKFERVEVE